jgi:hypothetical protein
MQLTRLQWNYHEGNFCVFFLFFVVIEYCSRPQMALSTVPGMEARTMVSPQPTTAWCTRRSWWRGNTPRGDSATAGYAGPPAGQDECNESNRAVRKEIQFYLTLTRCSCLNNCTMTAQKQHVDEQLVCSFNAAVSTASELRFCSTSVWILNPSSKLV